MLAGYVPDLSGSQIGTVQDHKISAKLRTCHADAPPTAICTHVVSTVCCYPAQVRPVLHKAKKHLRVSRRLRDRRFPSHAVLSTGCFAEAVDLPISSSPVLTDNRCKVRQGVI